jgi:ATP-dependent RNA helicase SUPV3L1/SUV3
LTRVPITEDILVLEHASRDDTVRALAVSPHAVERLWEVCQVPDYRKIAPATHAELVVTLYGFLTSEGKIPVDWFARQVAQAERTDGDIDTLSSRIAHIRTWTFAANRADWLADPEHWQGITRGIEDKLSDALHERLTERFVDRRTSVLVRRLRENAMLETDISKAGEVVVEGHPIGRLVGFQFAADAAAAGPDAKALRAAAQKALAGEIENRAMRLQAAPDEQFVLASDGAIRWTGEPVGKLVAGDDVLHPRIRLIADERLTGASRDAVQARLDLWLKTHIEKGLAPVFALATAEDVTGIARGVAFQLVEALGVLERHKVAEELKALDQTARGTLRKYGVRFGAYHVYLPALLKPAPRVLAAHLWALKNGGPQLKGIDELPHLAGSGRTSMPVDKEISKALYRTIGYRVCGERAVRVDILERLADLIRPLLAWRPGAAGEKPVGAVDGASFTVTMAMTSLTGASPEDFASVLRSLGYRMERRPKPASPPAETDAVPPAPESAEHANADVDSGREATCEVDVAPPAADGVIGSAADMLADPAALPETSTPTAADGSKPAAADDDVIEVWRPGRPEERRHRRPPARPRREPHVEPRGPQAPAPIAAAATPAGAASEGQAVVAAAEVAPNRRNDRAAAARAPTGPKPTGPKGRGEAKDRREKAPDPNSPFAKLAVLKAQLEARSKERH